MAPPKSVLCALLLLSLLCGCGGGGGTSATSQGAAKGQDATAGQSSPGHYEAGEEAIERFGSEARGQRRAAILGGFEGELEGIAEKDYAKACSHLSGEVQVSLARFIGKGKQSDCAKLLPLLLAPSAPAIARGQLSGKVTKVRVQGKQAFVVFKAPGAKLFQQTLVEEGGGWRTATVAAAVLVPSP